MSLPISSPPRCQPHAILVRGSDFIGRAGVAPKLLTIHRDFRSRTGSRGLKLRISSLHLNASALSRLLFGLSKYERRNNGSVSEEVAKLS